MENRSFRRTIFISGGGSGIGLATARYFIRRGWNAVVYDKDITKVEDSGFCLAISGDTTDRRSVEAAVAAAVERFGGIDAVFANAGIHQSDTIRDISDDSLRSIIDINIIGNVNVIRACIPALECVRGAVIINASDQSAVGKAHSFGYGLTKGALAQMTRSLAIDLADAGIRVNAVCPSTIVTPISEAAIKRAADRSGVPVAEVWEEERSLFLTGNVGEPDDVAAMVYFLAGDDAKFCTGGLYAVDGGYTAM